MPQIGPWAHVVAVVKFVYVYPVKNDVDVQAAAEKLLELFDTKAVPYFERYGSLEAIDHLLNDLPKQETPHRGYPMPRAASGLIVAKLVSRPNYLELLETYRSALAKLNGGFYLPQFEALAKSLEKIERAKRE